MNLRILTHMVRYLIAVVTIILLVRCSSDISSYEDIETKGTIEKFARKNHEEFFQAVAVLAPVDKSLQKHFPDSTDIRQAEQLTNRLIEAVRPFPSTLESRIALDALSFAARDIAQSSFFSDERVAKFWSSVLLKQIFFIVNTYMKSGAINESAHLQILRAIRRSVGTHISDEILIKSFPVIGASPPERIMDYCRSDSLFFKKIHDLILYSRSLQNADPPVWMATGSWFMALEFKGFPIIFVSFVPFLIDGALYLSFKEFNQGDIYAAVFNDPVSADSSLWNSWLDRALTTISSLAIDSTFAAKVRSCKLETYDAHMMYNDYLLHTDADSLSNKFWISITRQKFQASALQITGMDSIAVIFKAEQVKKYSGAVTVLDTKRTTGASVIGDQYFPGRIWEGKAYLMPLGPHNDDKVRALIGEPPS